MSTIFIAVQCCQCSTMQVKQQKKSSNKWNCVICNQKQSIRKVFAQGFLAKDVRKFVQSFNMSRKFIEENAEAKALSPLPLPPPPQKEIHNPTKRRSDWKEYLDPEDFVDDKQEEKATGGVSEPNIVTLPNEIFKKPKLKNYSGGLDSGGAKRLLKPNFSNRKRVTNQENEEGKELQSGKAKGTASKWSNFLSEEDVDELLMERGKRDVRDPWCQAANLDTAFSDQRVEDEVHPDFK
ncbi:MRN complex-interacting protein isoform X2 [Macadamia integrifolia]|uniref:MRN complex-interacting protein isoform X2 n=1 Tax=Macadamia integrifolia TaxID=60698 RepID=UPI001C4EB99B|nr:MRN complex-interacting protein isoform X2 [Macadamia integrifolia]